MELKNLVGTGARAKVYSTGDYAIKLYDEDYSKISIFYEALINSIIEATDLPVPKTYEVLNIGNQMALKMDYINGQSLIDCISKDPSNIKTYFEEMVKLQIEINSKKVFLPFSIKDTLRRAITENPKLDTELKEKALALLDKLPDGDTLCHGDFHGYNILVSEEKLWVIDWPSAGYGCAEADVCRTYMIYYMYSQEAAEMYLMLYCNETGQDREKILAWLPVLFTARLSENIPNEEERLLTFINDYFN